MNNNAQNHLNEIIKKDKIFYLDLCNRNLEGNMDLKDFTNLKTLNASNNKFENLDFLNSLPNKDKLQSLNFFGNEIKEIDFTLLLENFPNLKMLNLRLLTHFFLLVSVFAYYVFCLFKSLSVFLS